MINIFIGYDSKEKVAFNVLSYSILKNSSKPVAITPIYLDNIKDDFVRERNNLSSDYVPKIQTKFLNQVQTVYPKKNWSSVMLMNCKKCHTLTPDYVNKASGLELHQFKWLESEKLIGDIPLEWNWLADEYEAKKDVHNIHYTEGGPYFENYENCDYSDLWYKYYNECSKIKLS